MTSVTASCFFRENDGAVLGSKERDLRGHVTGVRDLDLTGADERVRMRMPEAWWIALPGKWMSTPIVLLFHFVDCNFDCVSLL